MLKALSLDPSIPQNKIPVKMDEGEDSSIYQRPYERHLKQMLDRVNLKQNIYALPKDDIEKVIMQLESASLANSENMRIDRLQKCLGTLFMMNDKEYKVEPEKDLVDEEIEKEKLLFKQKQLLNYKQKKQLAAQIAKMAFEWELNDLAIKACEFVVNDVWEVKNANEMIIV